MGLRRKGGATGENSFDEACAEVTATLIDGSPVHVLVEHAIGSLQNPMTQALLEEKFHGLSDPVLGKDQTTALINACWAVGNASNVQSIVQLATPKAS